MFRFILLICIVSLTCDAQIDKNAEKTMSAQKILKDISKGKTVNCKNITIEGDLDFTTLKESIQVYKNKKRVMITSPVYFDNCTFKGKVSAFRSGEQSTTTHFQFPVIFVKCSFEQKLDFNQSKFDNEFTLDECWFGDDMRIQNSSFRDDVSLSKSEFANHLFMQNCLFQGQVNAKEMTVNGQLHLQQSDFWRRANFPGIKVYQYADFGLTTFRSDFFLEYSTFHERATFGGADFRGGSDWHSTSFSKNLDLSRTFFARIPMWHQLQISDAVITEGISPKEVKELIDNKQ